MCAGGGSRGRFRRVPESSAECRRVPGSSGAGVGLGFRRVPASSGVCWCRFQRQVPEGSGIFRKVLEGCGKFWRVPARAGVGSGGRFQRVPARAGVGSGDKVQKVPETGAAM